MCRVVQIPQLIKFFSDFLFEKRKLLSFRCAKRIIFPLKVDWLTFASGVFSWSIALWVVGWDFRRVLVALDSIFFCILYSFFMFCATVSNNCDVLLKVKMKTLFERCLSNYTLMEIFSVFCLTFCEIFCKFLCFFCWFTLHVTD